MARQFGTRVTLEVMQNRLDSAPPSAPVLHEEIADHQFNLHMPGVYGALADFVEGPATLRQADQDADATLIRDWLSQLHMLKGVPFNYLVADMAMLPGESLRFFQVDKGWLGALIDGAFSIGAAGVDSSSAQQACVTLRDEAESAVQCCQARQSPGGDEPPVIPTGTGLSGFLLRSNLIAAWPGLEVEAFAGTTALSIVRMELLAPGLLLCLFNGLLTRVRFKLPAEAAHFGVREAVGGGYDKALRALTEPAGGATEHRVDVGLRPGGRRVVDLDGLARSMGNTLHSPLTSASFALQMVEGAQAVEFQWSH